jgi:ADP-heptose:LPS heptosyltransferase
VRLDCLGDVLVSGPAIRAVAAAADRVTMLAGPDGASAAALLPGVDAIEVWDCPWIRAAPPPVTPAATTKIVELIVKARASEALILTSFHQSALPTALVLRLGGVKRIAGVSEDYPGSLLDVRVSPPDQGPEAERMLAIARAAGFDLPKGDDGALAVRVRRMVPDGLPKGQFVVVHPGASAPARSYPAASWAAAVAELTSRGWQVLVTGGRAERELVKHVALAGRPPGRAWDCGGKFSLAELAGMLSRAAVMVAANTGPAHLAAAVGTPVVSLFAPTVSRLRWAPYRVPTVILGDQAAECRDSRARDCPVPGHPCLSVISAGQIADAVATLVGQRSALELAICG